MPEGVGEKEHKMEEAKNEGPALSSNQTTPATTEQAASPSPWHTPE